jgi:hypothetical protein
LAPETTSNQTRATQLGAVLAIIASIESKEEEETARRPHFPETGDAMRSGADYNQTRPDTIIRPDNAAEITILTRSSVDG